jgi:arginine-tRNA-protein transferase
VAQFKPSRAQRRAAQRHADLVAKVGTLAFDAEHYDLYLNYQATRHAGGGMDEAEASDFRRFLTAPWSPTLFLEFRQGTRLLGVAVTDVCLTGMSAVYTFFDPDETARSLGTFAILQQVELARRRGIPWLYLGFWIEGHPKMDYKRRYRPLQIRGPDGWKPMPDQD